MEKVNKNPENPIAEKLHALKKECRPQQREVAVECQQELISEIARHPHNTNSNSPSWLNVRDLPQKAS